MTYGEFWFIGGEAIGADGDVGDVNHSQIVMQNIAQELAEDFVSETEWDFDTYDDIDPDSLLSAIQDYLEENDLESDRAGINSFVLETLAFDKEKYKVLCDETDPRDYGLEHLGWQRVKGNSIQTWTLTPSDLKNIGNGLWGAYAEEVEEMSFDIEVSSSGKFYTNVPWSVLETDNLSALREYQSHYATNKKASLFKDLDFLAKR